MNQEIKQLRVNNFNNKLHCNGFIVMNKPLPEKPKIMDYHQIFEVSAGSGSVKVRLYAYYEVKYLAINDFHTIPAFGKGEMEWRREYEQQDPSVTDETIFGIYIYRRI